MISTPPSQCEVCSGPLSPLALSPSETLFRCDRCHHLHRTLADAPARARNHAWGGVGAFDRLRTGLTFRSQLRSLRKRGKTESGKRLDTLELGFGAGLMLKRHLAEGNRCSGLEAEMLETELVDGVAGKFRWIAGNAEEAVLPEESYDLIYAIHVVEHLVDPAIVFRKCYRSLRPGGMLHLLTPNGSSRGLSLFRAGWWNLEDPTHIRFFSPQSIVRSLSDAGFSEIEVTRPLWDSLVLEGASTARLFLRQTPPHGVLSLGWGKGIALLTAPFWLLFRAVFPPLNPSLSVTAQKGVPG